MCCQPAGGFGLPRGAKHVLEALSQLVGYLFIEGFQFGILTLYQYFWAVELCENGDVSVSPAYASTTRGENFGYVNAVLCDPFCL